MAASFLPVGFRMNGVPSAALVQIIQEVILVTVERWTAGFGS
jgi:hypothetical protein